MPRWASWGLVLAGWTLLASVFAISSSLTYVLAYQPPQWRQTFVMAFTEWHVWAAMTPLVVWLARRLMLRRGRWLVRGLVLAAAGFPVVVAKVTFTRMLRGLAGPGEYFLISSLATHYLIYWGVIGIVHAIENYRAGQARELRAAQLEATLADARMQLLKMQLQPHFLFNTLNAIAEQVHEDPVNAEKMIGGLSQLLRETLEAGMIDAVPLARELELLDRYVEIQRTRFGERLAVRVDVADEAARSALVPILLLQPLVENAIRHGIAARSRAGRIVVRARRSGSRLVLEVEDDGEGLRDAPAREGVGLGNTRARLAEMFGADHAFELTAPPAGGTLVTISIPWQAEALPASRRA